MTGTNRGGRVAGEGEAMKPRRPTAAEIATAYHEAGHALAAWKNGIGIRRISIVPKGDKLGRLQRRTPLRAIHFEWDGSDRARMRAEKLIEVSLAGPAAQRRFKPSSFRHCQAHSDHRQAVDLADYLNGNSEQAQLYLRWMERRASDLVANFWPLVEALALVLLERRTMTGKEAAEVFMAAQAQIRQQ